MLLSVFRFSSAVRMITGVRSHYLRRAVFQTLRCYGLSCLLALGILLILPFCVSSYLLYYTGGLFFLIPVLASAVKQWIPKEKIAPHCKAIFITGCDRGFGYMLAQRMDKIGFHVFAGCLFPSGDGAINLRKSGSNRMHVIGIDVTSDTSVREAAEYVKENLKENKLWAVVNNAGIVDGGEIDWTDTETIQRIFDVNTLGVVRVTKALLENLKESKGRVLAVASIAGRYTFPGNVPYASSKRATIFFCDGLRKEICKWGVKVITIEPALYRTAIVTEDVYKNALKSWEKAPEEVKEMYGSDYIQSFLKAMLLFTTNFSNNPEKVVSSMEDAIMSSYPENSYSVGIFPSWITVWILQMLRKPVADMCVLLALESAELW